MKPRIKNISNNTERNNSTVKSNISLLSKDDIFLFNEGKHYRLYEKLGAHLMTAGDKAGVYFAVWAPNAVKVTVIGDFNNWDNQSHPLRARDRSGIWEGFIPGIGKGSIYKYHIQSQYGGYQVDKADPLAFCSEMSPRTASKVWDTSYPWSDQKWMIQRSEVNALNAPISIYELHLGSWRRVPEENNRPLTYRETAPPVN